MARNIEKDMEKMERTGAAWKTHAAAGDKFYGMTQAEYDAKIERSRDVRRRLEENRRQGAALENERNDVDRENLDLEINVADSMGSDPRYGKNSSIWEATGRKRKSERKRPGKKPANPVEK